MIRASKQSSWYPSWLWRFPALLLHSTGNILRAGTLWVVLLPASLSLGTNSGLASKVWPWSVPLPTLLAFPRISCIMFGGSKGITQASMAIPSSVHLPLWHSCVWKVCCWSTDRHSECPLVQKQRLPPKITHHLISLCQTGVPRFHFLGFPPYRQGICLLILYSLEVLWAVTPSLRQLRNTFQARPLSSLQ